MTKVANSLEVQAKVANALQVLAKL